MEQNQEQNGPNDAQMSLLLRRFRSKNDLYKYLHENIVGPIFFQLF